MAKETGIETLLTDVALDALFAAIALRPERLTEYLADADAMWARVVVQMEAFYAEDKCDEAELIRGLVAGFPFPDALPLRPGLEFGEVEADGLELGVGGVVGRGDGVAALQLLEEGDGLGAGHEGGEAVREVADVLKHGAGGFGLDAIRGDGPGVEGDVLHVAGKLLAQDGGEEGELVGGFRALGHGFSVAAGGAA